jgi:signal peptidase II
MSKSVRWFSVALAIIVADQITKWVVLGSFAPGEGRVVTGFFNLVLVFNRGAAFSFLAQAGGWQAPLFIGFALVASLVVSWLILRDPQKRLYCLGLALILGGALGNVIDRVRFGHVVDFLDFHAFGAHWPAFNVADSAISVGAVLLVIESFLPRAKDDRAAS